MTNELPEILTQLQASCPEHGAVSLTPAGRWEDGTIVGNGTQGALCFGRPHSEEFILSHEALFLPIYPPREYFHLAPHLDHIRRLILQNRGDEAMNFTMDLAKAAGYEKRTLTDPFIGACSLNLDMPASQCNAYARSVDFATGGSLVAWEDKNGLYHRRSFASRADPIVAVEIRSPNGGPCSTKMELARIERDLDPEFYDTVVDETIRDGDENTLSFRVRLHSFAKSQSLLGYCVSLRAVPTGGQSKTDGHVLSITNAERILLLIAIEPEFADHPVTPLGQRQRLQSIVPEYDKLFARHAKIHAELFNRVSLCLDNTANEQKEVSALQKESAAGNTSLRLIQNVFDAGRYGIISGTGTLPPALQGIWTGTWRPNWSGDFTLNGNVQSAIASSLPGNHAECMRVTLDYLSRLLDDFRISARELFGFRGIYVPWRSSTHGQCHYAGYRGGHNSFPGMYWFAGTAWWAWYYYEYWMYTGDDDFFEKQLKPFYLESADFYEDYLTVEKDGTLVLVPSYSPENEPANGHCLQANATMTIACIRQLLRTLLLLSDRLDVSPDRQEHWRELLGKLPDYTIDESGALSEWSWPGIRNNENHRHASHLHPLYDGVAPEIKDSKELQEACRIAIDKRLEYRREKNGAEMAFGIVQLGMAASNLRDKTLALECVEWLTNSYWSPMLVSQHDPGDILNLDISGGLPAVIINMLVQSSLPDAENSSWRITLLPCLPESWSKGSLSGIRCRGGFGVSFAWDDGNVTEISVTSLRGEACVVEFGLTSQDLTLNAGETWTYCP